MGVYGYPVDEEELEAARKREIEGESNLEDLEEILEDEPLEEDEEGEDEEEETKPSGKKGMFTKLKNYIFCTEPSLMTKMRGLLSKEDFEYLRTDFFWYVAFTVVPFLVGMFLAIIMFRMGENDALLFAVVFFCFGGGVVTNLWRGKVWYYVRRSVSDRKAPMTPEQLAALVPKFRSGDEDVPVRKFDFALFFGMMALAVAMIFM